MPGLPRFEDEQKSGVIWYDNFHQSPYLGFGIFSRLVARDNFIRVKVSFDTIEWDSGADLDPAFVYQKCLMVA